MNLMVLILALFFYHSSKYTKRKKLLVRYLRFIYRLLPRCRHGSSIDVLLDSKVLYISFLEGAGMSQKYASKRFLG